MSNYTAKAYTPANAASENSEHHLKALQPNPLSSAKTSSINRDQLTQVTITQFIVE
jgi:hypothetical protein